MQTRFSLYRIFSVDRWLCCSGLLFCVIGTIVVFSSHYVTCHRWRVTKTICFVVVFETKHTWDTKKRDWLSKRQRTQWKKDDTTQQRWPVLQKVEADWKKYILQWKPCQLFILEYDALCLVKSLQCPPLALQDSPRIPFLTVTSIDAWLSHGLQIKWGAARQLQIFVFCWQQL